MDHSGYTGEKNDTQVLITQLFIKKSDLFLLFYAFSTCVYRLNTSISASVFRLGLTSNKWSWVNHAASKYHFISTVCSINIADDLLFNRNYSFESCFYCSTCQDCWVCFLGTFNRWWQDYGDNQFRFKDKNINKIKKKKVSLCEAIPAIPMHAFSWRV